MRGMSISFLTGGVLGVPPRRFGDVDRQVADALEVGVDLHGRDDRAQVGGHRLVQREQREAAVVDLDVQPLIGSSPFSTCSMSSRSRSVERLDGEAHLFLGQAAHLEQPRLELLELFLEMPYDAFDGSMLNRIVP